MTDEELKRLLDAMRQENSAAHEQTQRKSEGFATATARHFDVVAERLEQRLELVAESVAQMKEELNRETNALRQEMSRGFAETQAMIEFSL
jgi:DNA-binding transcriptional MerR regulator